LQESKKPLKLNHNRKWYNIQPKIKRRIIQLVIALSAIILTSDFIYKTVKDITYANRHKCFLYLSLPKKYFLAYEYFIELFMVVVLGIFMAVLLEKWFNRFKKFYPRNQLTAFIYGSIIPVCSCSVIPLLNSMRDKLSMRTMITFIISAPLLNPYIIVLSFSALGIKYGILRIVCSFILAMLSGIVVEHFYRKSEQKIQFNQFEVRKDKASCLFIKPDIYLQTYQILKSVLPYLIIAGILGLLVELYLPIGFIQNFKLIDKFFVPALMSLVGAPLYYCNGADIIMLRPLVNHNDLLLGSAIAFSLTSTSICITSIVMLLKFLGKRLAIVLTITIILLTYIIAVLINCLV